MKNLAIFVMFLISLFFFFTAKADGPTEEECQTKYETRYVYRTVVKEKKVLKKQKNHLQLHILDAPSDGLSTTGIPNGIEVESGSELTFGFTYSRDLFDLTKKSTLTLGVTYLSNESIGGTVGLKW